MINRQRMLDTFLRLAAIDSVSREEGAVVAAVRRELEAAGCAVAEDGAAYGIGGQAGNLIARLPGHSAAPALLLNAHVDTVEPGRGIKPQVSATRIASDGTTILGADDKAGVACIIEVVRALDEDNLAHAPLEIVLTVSEEIGLLGAKQLDYSRITARTGFVLDGDGPVGAITVSAPSHDSIRATITGRAAHAGVAPEKGINAIKIAADAITGMRVGRIDEETTANVGTISGGRASNIVPDRVEIVAEARSRDAAKLRRQTRHMVGRLKRAAQKSGGECAVEVNREYEAYNLPEDEAPVSVAAAAMRSLGIEPRFQATGGGSDSNIFNAHGIRTAVLSIGFDEPHATSEWLDIEQLELAARLVLTIAQRASVSETR